MNDNTDQKREEELFEQARSLGSEDLRLGFLKGACGDDLALYGRLVDLLEAYGGDDNFIQTVDSGSTVTFESPADSEQEGAVYGRYKLLERLGEGGFGSVWAAEQKEPVRRRVALKIIKLGMDTKKVVARFEAERQALALMDHPNIARVLDAGSTDTGRPYFVMELVKGVSMTHYCDREKLSTQARLDLFIKVCQAIQHAHQKGIIHRDIKPSNIMVTLHDGVPVPKVIDFGIAKATQQELTEKTIYTQYSQFIGTPAYMSPEQAELSGLDIDTRSDIYSLGVLLYELLTGTTPFDTEELMKSGLDEMRKIIREQEPIRPSTRLSQAMAASVDAPKPQASVRVSHAAIESDVDWIVMKCLEKDRSRRYDTANGLVLDLRRHLGNEPILARPPSSVYKLRKTWQRNRLAFSSAAVVLITITAALLFASVSLVRERNARALADSQTLKAQEQEGIARMNAEAAAEQGRIALQNLSVAKENAHKARLNQYAADMNLAQAAIVANNYGRAVRFLDRHRPKEGETDIRGWEWRYFWQQVQGQELYSLPDFGSDIADLDHSPDGRQLAIGLWDGRVVVWDLLRNVELRTFLLQTEGQNAGFAQCQYSPDGRLLAAFGLQSREVRLWDARSFEARESLVLPSSATLSKGKNLGFSADSRYVAVLAGYSASGTKAVVLESKTGEVLWEFSFGLLGNLEQGQLCFSSDEGRMYVGDTRGLVHCVDLATGTIERNWQAHARDGITAISISPDGKILATGVGYALDDIKLWDSESGALIGELSGHSGWISSLEFSLDGTTLVSTSADQTARIWDVQTLAVKSVLRGHRDEVYSLSLSPDGTQMVTGSKDGLVHIWSTLSEEAGLQYRNRSISFPISFHSPDGKSLFVCAEQDGLLEFDSETLEEVGPVIDFGNTGSSLFYQIARGMGWGGWHESENETLVVPSFTSDSRFVFIPRDSGTDVYNLKTRQLVRSLDEFITSLGGGVNSDEILVARVLTGEIEVRDTTTWEVVGSVPSIRIDLNLKWAVSSDGRNVAMENEPGMVSIYRLSPDFELVPVTEFKAARRHLSGITFSPNGRLLATSSASGEGFLWSTDDWSVVATLEGHSQGIQSVRFSPDSTRLLTGSSSPDAVRLWDVTSQQELVTLRAEGSAFQSVSLSDDGRTLFARSLMPTPMLHVWSAPTWEEIEAAESEKRRGKGER